MKRAIVTCLSILLSLYFSHAQSLSIRVTDEENEGLIGANIQLTNLADSTILYGVTGQDGVAEFSGVKDGRYGIQISYIGYQTLDVTEEIRTGEKTALVFSLTEESVALSAVTVTGRRPIITQDGDKMIVDPEPLASISSNALELLEAVPGLFVDPEGGIFLTNATPAQIYINGREQRMGQQDMSAILRSLPPGSIQRIEVLRTPSTRYDAASSGGIVNIVLKKGVRLGRFGSVNAGFNQGVYGDRFAGFSLNDSGDKTTFYLNANYNYNSVEETGSLFRPLNDSYSLEQDTRSVSRNNQAYAGYGLSYDINDKLVFSYDGRLNGAINRGDSRNTQLITAGEEDPPLSEIDNRTANYSPSLNLTQDLGLTWKLDTLGSEWDTKGSYSYRTGNNEQDFRADILFPELDPIVGEGLNRQGRHFLLLQSDLTYQFAGKTKVETGLKTTLQAFGSQADYFLLENGALAPDDQRTNAFDYQERISAAYAQASRPLLWGILLKAGLRLEHTWMRGRQTVPADTSFLINRFDLFPYLYISRPIMKIADFDVTAFLIYRRTINRPGYQNLNPYIRYIDEFSYETGNPALQPQFTQNIEANISVNDMPLFALGRNYTDGIQSSVIYPDAAQPAITVRTYDNIGQSRETYFRAVGGIPPGGKYFFMVGGQYNLNEYEGEYDGQPLVFRRGSWRIFSFHALNLTKNTRLALSGFLWLNGLVNFSELENMGQLNLSLNQSFFKKKLQVSLFARDVLRTMETRFQLNQPGLFLTGSRYNDARRVGFRIRYDFGLNKKEERGDFMRFDGGE
jgi:hypothetical protein